MYMCVPVISPGGHIPPFGCQLTQSGVLVVHCSPFFTCQIDFRIKAEFSSRLFGTNVVIKVPTPKSTANCKINISTGKAKYEAEHRSIVWRCLRQGECCRDGSLVCMRIYPTMSKWTQAQPSLLMQGRRIPTSRVPHEPHSSDCWHSETLTDPD